MISAEIVADSINPQGDRLTSLLITFPRFILAEINTHRMLSKNTSSSRAIPFNKMIEAVKSNPFIPIAWQKEHKGMQGSEYFKYNLTIKQLEKEWLNARDRAVNSANILVQGDGYEGLTKQLCNRLLEPFMWTTMLITGSKEGWDNFFELRCPVYRPVANTTETFKSKKDAEKRFGDLTGVDWFRVNDGQAEIHIMDLAEKIYDVMNESIPRQLKPEEWHIPFYDKIVPLKSVLNNGVTFKYYPNPGFPEEIMDCVKISTAMAARTSYTVVGDEKEIDYQKMIGLHDRLIEMRHDSPLEHCARAMNDDEYVRFLKVTPTYDSQGIQEERGWCRNYKGFIQYRHIIETNK